MKKDVEVVERDFSSVFELITRRRNRALMAVNVWFPPMGSDPMGKDCAFRYNFGIKSRLNSNRMGTVPAGGRGRRTSPMLCGFSPRRRW